MTMDKLGYHMHIKQARTAQEAGKLHCAAYPGPCHACGDHTRAESLRIWKEAGRWVTICRWCLHSGL